MDCLHHGTMSNGFVSILVNLDVSGALTLLLPPLRLLGPGSAFFPLKYLLFWWGWGCISFLCFNFNLSCTGGLSWFNIQNYLRLLYIPWFQKSIAGVDSSSVFVYTFVILKTLLFYLRVFCTFRTSFHILVSFRPVSDCQVSHLKTQFLSFYFPSQKSSILFNGLQEQAQTPYSCIYEII